MTLKFARASNNLQFQKNKEPWRLTSQPSPQGGNPQARGNNAQMEYIQHHHKTRSNMKTTLLQNIYNPNQGLHNDSQMES